MDDLDELPPGHQLGSYTLIRKLGAGGMGTVYQARHGTLARPAAVKVLSSWLTTGLGRMRFEREVQACAALTHPNTVEIYDYGETPDGTLYYAMEYLDGFDLKQLIDLEGRQTAARTLRILEPIAGALGEAHAHGLVHRDIKPPNIIVCEAGGIPDVAKLVDFGLVAPLKQKPRLTLEGHVMGTPRYVAPEMIGSGRGMSPASDIYSLGLVAFYLLSGRHAFDAESSVEILHMQRDEPAPHLVHAAPGCPEDLANVIAWCLEKDPDRRPASAAELSEAFARCEDFERWNQAEARAWWARQRTLRIAQLAERSMVTEPDGPPVMDERISLTNPEGPAAKKRARE
ncbi:MAG: serine/threonine-protein kinase [Sandaracinaceae bacterium]